MSEGIRWKDAGHRTGSLSGAITEAGGDVEENGRRDLRRRKAQGLKNPGYPEESPVARERRQRSGQK